MKRINQRIFLGAHGPHGHGNSHLPARPFWIGTSPSPVPVALAVGLRSVSLRSPGHGQWPVTHRKPGHGYWEWSLFRYFQLRWKITFHIQATFIVGLWKLHFGFNHQRDITIRMELEAPTPPSPVRWNCQVRWSSTDTAAPVIKRSLRTTEKHVSSFAMGFSILIG